MPGFARRVSKKYFLKQSGARGGSVAKMNDANRAMCYALRFPPKGGKPMKYDDIRKLVRKTDGRKPTIQAIQLAATSYRDEKGQRGRPLGWRCTSKAEDKKILATMHKMRPPGHYVDSRIVKDSLPKQLQKKVSRKTILRSPGASPRDL